MNKSGCLTFNFDVSSYFTFSLSPKIDNVSPDDGALFDRSSLRTTRKSENEGRAGSDNIVRDMDIKRRNGTDSHTNAVYGWGRLESGYCGHLVWRPNIT